MRLSIALSIIAVSLAIGLVAIRGIALAQDQAKVSPETTKVALDNDRVRVFSCRYPPGSKIPMHSHPGHFIYAITDAKLKITFPDKPAVEKELKPGDTFWSDPVVHALENVGPKETHYILVELKDK